MAGGISCLGCSGTLVICDRALAVTVGTVDSEESKPTYHAPNAPAANNKITTGKMPNRRVRFGSGCAAAAGCSFSPVRAELCAAVGSFGIPLVTEVIVW